MKALKLLSLRDSGVFFQYLSIRVRLFVCKGVRDFIVN